MTLYVNFGTEKTHWLTQRESLFSKIQNSYSNFSSAHKFTAGR